MKSVVISVDLAGNPIGLNVAGEVWISDHDFGGTRKVAKTFERFVEGLLAYGGVRGADFE